MCVKQFDGVPAGSSNTNSSRTRIQTAQQRTLRERCRHHSIARRIVCFLLAA